MFEKIRDKIETFIMNRKFEKLYDSFLNACNSIINYAMKRIDKKSYASSTGVLFSLWYITELIRTSSTYKEFIEVEIYPEVLKLVEEINQKTKTYLEKLSENEDKDIVIGLK